MASTTLRRRLHHGDANERNAEQLDTSGSDVQEEPLLGNSGPADGDLDEYGHRKCERCLDDQGKKCFYWTSLFSHFIARCAQCLAKTFTSLGSVLRRFLSLTLIGHKGVDKNTPLFLSPLQEESLSNLQQRLEVPFDGTRVDHQDALKVLWMLAYPDRELPSLKSELWKEMGWQSPDPSTDFRAGGFMSLENLIYFARKYPDSFHTLLYKKDGTRAEWEYPFAVAGVNISFMLAQIFDLQSGRPNSKAGVRLLELLGHDEMAFDDLYCVTFLILDAQWLAKGASYMEFNEVLKCTRIQLERELSLDDVSSIKDLPSYNLLHG